MFINQKVFSIIIKGAVTPVKDHANNAALPLSGGSSPVFKSPSQYSPPQRDKPKNNKESKGTWF